jgi:chemotaxis protein CheY-P-specific phosphatase CheC
MTVDDFAHRETAARTDHMFTDSVPLEACEPGQHLNALREVAHTASRAASGALSRSLRRRVTVTVPEFAVSLLDQLPAVLAHADRPLVFVTAQLLGDISGPLAWVMSAPEAERLAGALLTREPGSIALDDAAIQAVLIRSAHTLAAAYADVLGALTHGVVFLSVPELVRGSLARLLTRPYITADPRHPNQLSVCVGSRLRFDDEGLAVMGHLIYLPHHPAFGRILRALAD